jgi:Lysophospholipase
MEHRWILGSDGKTRLSVTVWLPAQEPIGVIQLLHGMRQHMGQYNDFARFLTVQGFAVCGHDQLGHGRTGKAAGHMGYFGESNGPRYLVRDCHMVTRYIQNRFPGRRIFLFGHSMGSFIGRIYITQTDAVAGFLCLGTGGEWSAAPYISLLIHSISVLHGKEEAADFMYHLAFSTHHKKYETTSNHSAWLSRDLASGRAFAEDKLSQYYFTYQALLDFVDVYFAAVSPVCAMRTPKSLPIFIASGGDDLIGSFGHGPIGVYEHYRSAGIRDIHCKLYPGGRHELLNEINREEVYFDLLNWILQHLSGKTPAR